MTIKEIDANRTKQNNIHDAAAQIVAILDGIGSDYDDDAREEVLRLVTEDAE